MNCILFLPTIYAQVKNLKTEEYKNSRGDEKLCIMPSKVHRENVWKVEIIVNQYVVKALSLKL